MFLPTTICNRLACLLTIGLCSAAWNDAARGADRRAESIEFFEARIRPVLVEYCYECHNAQQQEGGLALDSRDGLRSGGDRQRALGTHGRIRNLILEAIRHDHDELKMPEGGAQLSRQTIADFEKWFADGAADPRDEPPPPEDLLPERLRELVFAQRSKWWALQPLARTEPPALDRADWLEHPIDRFTFPAMHKHGLKESPPAPRGELLRRLSFALTGLPPTSQELAEFEQSAGDPSAIDHRVERLLASPRFGERWARHWMDWIRYAESHGSEGDPAIPYAYQYRDYLIRALNDDIPYDRLVEEHLAGDLLDQPRINSELGINESAIGPAHLRMVFHGFAPTDAMEEKVRFVDDQIAAISKAFLGLTVACARCHDHKFDAVRHKDYYALFGILGSCHPGIVDVNTPERQQARQPELARLKHPIRERVAARWLAATDAIFQRLTDPEPDLEKAMRAAKDPAQTLFIWKQLLESGPKVESDQPSHARRLLGDSVRKTLGLYQQHAALVAAEMDVPKSDETVKQTQLDIKNWFADGNGSCRDVAAAGEFTVAISGPRAIESVLPAGHYSHLLSTLHRNVWLSPRIELDEPYELWLLVAGGGDASVRYAVHDYPRNGTVYPVTGLKDRKWRWQRYDLAYWQGDSIHVELTTAGDAPVLARENQRSWFGIREARLVREGQPVPETRDFEQFAVMAESFVTSAPETVEELCACWSRELQSAIEAWRQGSATDQQALWLDAWITARLLPEIADSAGVIEAPTAAAQSDQPAETSASSASPNLVHRYREVESQVPLPTRVPGVWETVGSDQALYIRGDHRQAADAVPRGFLAVFDDQPYQAARSGRLELALSILGKSQALAARVIVNRLWHHLFGRGLVATPDNFGKLGVAPTHPELLDYLARDLIENHWSLKHTIRLIVTSRTWQQSSQSDADSRARDPDNLWLARAPLRRLEAEAIRDAQLSTSGQLDLAMYGPAVAGSRPRRSLYVQVLRNSLEPQLRVFDFPEPTSTIGRRDVTNVPAQALMLSNNQQIRTLARAWAQSALRHAAHESDAAAIDQMFRGALARRPEASERADALALRTQMADQWQRLVRERAHLEAELASTAAAKERILSSVRAQHDSSWPQFALASVAPQPIAAWEFDDQRDSIGKLAGEVIGNARIADGALITEGGYFKSAVLPYLLTAKTLEVWITVADLNQRGGGAMSVQTLGGEVFDALVLGEQRPAEWLAGSNFFARTKPFDGPAETVADRPIHFALTYASDGRVTGYRDGKPYGVSYISSGVQTFDAQQTVITFGCRHLPAGGNKLLRARWERAQLYDRALSADEVAASFQSQPRAASESEIVAALDPHQRETIATLDSQAAALRLQLQSLGEAPVDAAEVSGWTEVALALFNAKEFIFVK